MCLQQKHPPRFMLLNVSDVYGSSVVHLKKGSPKKTDVTIINCKWWIPRTIWSVVGAMFIGFYYSWSSTKCSKVYTNKYICGITVLFCFCLFVFVLFCLVFTLLCLCHILYLWFGNWFIDLYSLMLVGWCWDNHRSDSKVIASYMD